MSERSEASPRARARGLSEQERARIRELAQAGMAVREIAAETGRAPSTVSKVARAELAGRRGQTAVAAETRRTDARARRAELAAALLDDLDAARRLLRQQSDPQRAMWAARVVAGLVGAHVRLTGADRAEDPDGSLFDQWLREMTGMSEGPAGPNMMGEAP